MGLLSADRQAAEVNLRHFVLIDHQFSVQLFYQIVESILSDLRCEANPA